MDATTRLYSERAIFLPNWRLLFCGYWRWFQRFSDFTTTQSTELKWKASIDTRTRKHAKLLTFLPHLTDYNSGLVKLCMEQYIHWIDLSPNTRSSRSLCPSWRANDECGVQCEKGDLEDFCHCHTHLLRVIHAEARGLKLGFDGSNNVTWNKLRNIANFGRGVRCVAGRRSSPRLWVGDKNEPSYFLMKSHGLAMRADLPTKIGACSAMFSVAMKLVPNTAATNLRSHLQGYSTISQPCFNVVSYSIHSTDSFFRLS